MFLRCGLVSVLLMAITSNAVAQTVDVGYGSESVASAPLERCGNTGGSGGGGGTGGGGGGGGGGETCEQDGNASMVSETGGPGAPALGSLQNEFPDGSLVDNATFNHHHIAKDYQLFRPSSGCSSCGDSVLSQAVLEGISGLMIERRHRLRDQSVAGSFGPGVFHNYDVRVEVYPVGTGFQMDLFDPAITTHRRFVDGLEGDTLDGRFVDKENLSMKEVRLLDGGVNSEGQSTGNLTTTLANAKSIRFINYEGGESHYEIVSYAQTQPAQTAGQIGDALEFDGVDDFAEIGNPSALRINAGQITLSAWIKPQRDTTVQNVIARGRYGSSQVFLRLNNNNYEVGSESAGVFNIASVAGVSGDLNTWVHLVGTYDGTNWNLYKNGVLVNSQASTVGAISLSVGWAIGARYNGSKDFFKGAIDEVRIHNRGLTAAEVTDLFNGTAVPTNLRAYWPLNNRSVADAAGTNHGSLGSIAGEKNGRLTRNNNRYGYGTKLQYKTFTPAEIAAIPSRQQQVDTITDVHGRTATFTYKSTQVSGVWVVEKIVLPNGQDIDYTYNNGRLSQVDHPDGTQTTITVANDPVALTTNVTYDDPAAETTHRRKTVYLTNQITVSGDGNSLYNQSSLMVRMVVNGEGEVSYLNLPDITPGANGVDNKNYYFQNGQLISKPGVGGAQYLREGWTITNTPQGPAVTGALEGTFATLASEGYNHETFNTGKLPQLRDEQGRIYTYEYEADPFVSKKTYVGDNTTESWKYDSFKQVKRYRDRLNRVTKYDYDAQGNETKKMVGILASASEPDNEALDVNQPEYAEYVTEYYPAGDANQFLKRYSFDPNGNRTEYIYNADHQLTEIREPDDTGTGYHTAASFTYDSAKRMATKSDALNRTITYSYDLRDRVTQLAYDDGSTEQTVYGANGSGDENLVVFTKDRGGYVTQMQYDNHGRLVSKTVAAGSVGPNGSILAGFTPPSTLPEEASTTTFAYRDGSNLVVEMIEEGRKTVNGYDYRNRLVSTTVTPRQGTSLTTTKTYINNLLFCSTDPYGRKMYYAYRNSDSAMIRTVQGLVPSFNLNNFAAVISADRGETWNAPATGTDRLRLIRDVVLDAEGQTFALVDARGIVDVFGYDSRGRQTLSIKAGKTLPQFNISSPFFDVTNTANLDPVHAKTQTIYDLADNVSEVRSPRYFDASDTNGSGKARETYTHTRRNLVLTHSEAPGTPEGATESFTYDLRKRQETRTDFNNKVWTNLEAGCCGLRQASIDPRGNGTIVNLDSRKQAVHTIVVSDINSIISNPNNYANPDDSRTLSETTTRFDGRGRPVYRTTWLVPRGLVDTANPPIAGLNGIPSDQGLTTQYIYDDNLTDGVGLESTTGVSVLRLGTGGTGSTNVTLSAAIAKLAEPQTSDGTATTFDTTAPGSAMVTIGPEDDVTYSIMDATGRNVMTGSLQSWKGTTPAPNSLVNRTFKIYDVTSTLGGYGVVLETINQDALGHRTRQLTDGAGRVHRSIDQAGKITNYALDGAGNQLSVRDANGVGADMVYDVLGRNTARTDTAGEATSTTYDLVGNARTNTDAKSKVVTTLYDARNRRVSTTDRIASQTVFSYRASGELLTLTDGEGQKTEYVYDDVGNKTSEQYPDHTGGTPGQTGYGIVSFTYDGANRPRIKTDQKGDTVTYAYDLAGRLTSRAYRIAANSPTGTVADTDSFTYDKASRMLSAVSGRYNNTVNLGYDPTGRKISEALVVPVNATTSRTYNVRFGYTFRNEVNRITFPDNSISNRTFNSRGLLNTVRLDDVTLDTRVYDDGGRLSTSTYGNGTVTTWGYTPNDNLVNSINTANPAWSSDSEKVGNLSYGWDDNKNKTSETINNTVASVSNYGFTVPATGYDDEDRLVGWNRADGNQNQSWNLTKVGDWDDFTFTGGSHDRTHGPTHELTMNNGQTVGHDVKGNQIQLPISLRTVPAALNMTWDFDNRMQTANDGVSSVSFRYDALGRRIARTQGTSTVVFVHADQQVVADYNLNSGATTPLFRYVYGSYVDEPIARKVGNGTANGAVLYYHRNQQYSVTALSNSTGAVIERYAYTAYGQPTFLNADGTTATSSLNNNRYTYTGREWDGALGLYHFRARYMSPITGRFLSRDPIGYKGSPYNLYEYVDSNPVKYLDPTGKQIMPFPCIPGQEPCPRVPENEDPLAQGCLIVGGVIITCITPWPGDEEAVIGGLIGRCCNAVKAAKIAKQIKQLQEQLERINEEIESLEYLLELVNEQLRNSVYESPEWDNDVRNRARIEQDLRRKGTTKRRLLNELIDLGRKGC